MNRNIPLVQDNSVSSINTSLCAINRAIGQNGVPEVNVNVNYNVTDEVSADNIYPVTSRGVKAALDDLDENVNELIDNLSETVTEHSTITTSSDSTPYSQRVNADKDKSVINKLIGASFAINQLVQNGNFADTGNWYSGSATLSVSNNVARITYTGSAWNNDLRESMPLIIANHKYLAKLEQRCSSILNEQRCYFGEYNTEGSYFGFNFNTSWSNVERVFYPTAVDTTKAKRIVPSLNGSSYSGEWFEIRNFYIIDLTKMFGSAIADRIYAMEQATEGSGIAWIKSFGFFNKDYYATDEGSLQNVKPSAHKVSASVVKWFANRNTSSQYTLCLYAEAILKPNTNYTLYFRGANGANIYTNENIFTIIGTATLNGSLQSMTLKTKTELPYANATRFDNGWGIFKNAQGNTVIPNFTEFYIVEEGVNADPTFSQSIPLADTELRGIPKLDANNNLYFDGDVYYPNGDVIRKYGVVDLGSLTWAQQDVEQTSCSTFWSNDIQSLVKSPSANNEVANIVCGKYSTVSFSAYFVNPASKGVSVLNNGQLRISDPDNTYNKNAGTFKTAMNGVYLIYELVTPTKETVAGYSNPHTLIRKGAEEFVDDRTIALPVGHETEYAQLPSWLSNNVIFL